MVGRLKALLPSGWFTGDTPVLDGVLAGIAEKWAWVYDLVAYTRLQTRIRTATDQWLDLAAQDYFGADLARFPAEGDVAYRARILANLLPERATRAALVAVLVSLTGRTPWVFEPAHTGDTGAWGDGALAWRGMAYGADGGWGSLTHPFQAFLVAYRPQNSGVANVAGFSAFAGSLSSWQTNGDSVLTPNSAAVPQMVPDHPVTRAVLPVDAIARVAGFLSTSATAGLTYEASAWVWIPSAEAVVSIAIQAESGSAGSVSHTEANPAIRDGWQRISGRFVAAGGSVNLVVRLAHTSGSPCTVYLADARLDLSPPPYTATGGYGVGAIEYIGDDMIDADVPDEAIYQTIANAAPAGSIIWTRIEA